MSYAENTNVSVEKSRAELETILRKYGADTFGYITAPAKAMIQFRANGRHVKFLLPLPDPKEKRFTHQSHRTYMARTPEASAKEWEQACRSAWRALLLCVKAKLEAVERKITTFEEEFMAHIVLPDGSTVGEQMLPRVTEAYRTGLMPSFTLALPAPREEIQ